MYSGRIGCDLAILAVLCVLSIFLFPAGHGPYPVIHGPVTALQAVRVAARLRLAILAAALALSYALAPVVTVFLIQLWRCKSLPAPLLELNTILRC